MKVYVTIQAWEKTIVEMFYDLTMIHNAGCLVFIPRLAKWKVCYLQSTLVTKTACAKKQLLLKM